MAAQPDLQERQAQQVQQIRSDTLERLLSLWLGLKSWQSSSDISRFLAQALPTVEGGEVATANTTAAVLAAQYAALTDTPLRHIGVPPNQVSGKALRGADPRVVYARPFVQLYTALSKGASFDTAFQQGTNRLKSIASTDLQLSKTHATRLVMGQQKKVSFFARTLNGPHSCALCIVASTQRYHSGDLMPIHPGCDCGVKELPDKVDPGDILDRERLEAVHQAVRDLFGASDRGAREISLDLKKNSKGDLLKYRDVVLTVHEHGEIGPLLAVRGQTFTGPKALPGG